jgi:hypothetical protein
MEKGSAGKATDTFWKVLAVQDLGSEEYGQEAAVMLYSQDSMVLLRRGSHCGKHKSWAPVMVGGP